MTLVTFKVKKMASLTRVRFGYFPTKYFNVLSKQNTNFRHLQKVLFHLSSWLNVKGQEIKMPSLSPTMTEGKIVKWLKKEGDSVAPGDVLCDIETDKAVVSMETEEEGILAKILIPENTTEIKVGTLIAMMVAEGEDWKSVELPSGESSSSSSSSGGSAPAETPVASGPPTIPVQMPSLSPTMTAGTIVKWLKKEGDKIAPGDVLCDIQTDKAVMSLETDEEGILAKIIKPDDSKDVQVGTLIALIVAEGEDWKSVVVPTSTGTGESKVDSSSPVQPASAVAAKSGPSKTFGPAVRGLLSLYQLEPGIIQATGRNNKILKEDVLRYIAENNLQKKPPKSIPPPSIGKAAKEAPAPSPVKQVTISSRRGPKYIDIELSNVRKVIAKRLSQSKQEIPHSYGNIQCNIDNLIKLRRKLMEEGGKASLNDFIVKSVAHALQECPRINANYVNNEVKLMKEIDISVAVATENGLITPIVKGANTKSVLNISSEIKDLAGRARKGGLKPHEFQGGTFTISNLGMFGINHFSAIINPPQCAILAVGGAIERLGSDLRTYSDVKLTLSYDRRAIQEDEAAEFLEVLRSIIENPRRLLVDNLSRQAARV